MLSGNYKVLDKDAKVCIVCLTSKIEGYFFDGVNIAGSLTTENLGVERIIINTVCNPKIRAFIICGKESFGHYAGQALYSVWKNGVDSDGKIIGARGPIPYLENIESNVVDRFREQIVFMDDAIDITEPEEIRKRLDEILERDIPAFEKEPMHVAGLGKKTATKILECSEKLYFTEKISIDPMSLKIETTEGA